MRNSALHLPEKMKMNASNSPLIVALDYPTAKDALALVDELDDLVNFYKIGLQLCMSGDYFELITALNKRNKKIFSDLKFYDVPQTVHNAVKQLSNHPIEFCTVHGNQAILQAAVEAAGSMGILAVSVLTSLDTQDLLEMGLETPPETLVMKRVENAEKTGCIGVVASALEAKRIQSSFPKLLIVTPGIRLEKDQSNDQKRTCTPTHALENGSHYLVVGRSITHARNPIETTQQWLQIIRAYKTNFDPLKEKH